MDHYFLNNGSPDHSKTPEPLAIQGYFNYDELHDRFRRIDGLDFCLGGPSSTVCIGWDRRAVASFANNIGKKSQEELAQEQEDEWEEVMQEHRDFVASIKKKKSKKGALTDREKLEKCKGSYVVRCDDLADGWDNCDSLGIDISTGPKAGILQAAVEFGIIEGAMLLSFVESELDEYIEMAFDSDDSDSDRDEDDEDDSEGGYLVRTASSKRRKAPSREVAKAGNTH